MKKMSVAAVLSLAVMSTSSFAKMSSDAPFIPGEVLVKVKPGFMGKFLAKKSLLGAEVKRELKLIAGDYLLLKTNAFYEYRLFLSNTFVIFVLINNSKSFWKRNYIATILGGKVSLKN